MMLEYFTLGLKLLVVSIISGIITLFLQFLITITYPILGFTSILILLLVFFFVMVFVNGFVAKKLFEWE